MLDRVPSRESGDPRPRVLHLVINLEVGGLEQVVLNQLRHEDRSRFDVGVLCLGQSGRLANEARALGVPVQALGVHGRVVAGILRLARELRRCRPDVLHTHDLAPHLVGAPAARMARVPVVVHTRHCQTGPLTARQSVGLRLASALSDALVAVSADSAHLLSLRDGGAPEKRRVIRNGVDIATFEPGERWERPAEHRVVTVGRLTTVKNYPVLLHAAHSLAAALPRFSLDVVGDGPERGALEALARSLGIEHCVRFLGARSDVREFLALADVFALSSTSEGLSVSLLEALACGLPAVVTAVGGNPEVVTDGSTGILVPCGDSRALAAALQGLLSDPVRLAAMGRAARLRVEEHFNLLGVVARYERLYLELLGSG